MQTTVLVIPCYNEGRRLDVGAFQSFLGSHEDVQLVLVNDGSRDDTLAVIERIRAAVPERTMVVDLPHNVGKGEAVRQGMLRALDVNPEAIGFWDADLSTPLSAVLTFVALLEANKQLDLVIGSRVLLLGRTIERNPLRHYTGRVFATATSMALRLPVYDTQCGAKLFRATSGLRRVISAPFRSRWVFDVEMIARLGALTSAYSPELLRETIYEHPLTEWRNAKGSKLRATDFAIAAWDLVVIHMAYVRRGASARADKGWR